MPTVTDTVTPETPAPEAEVSHLEAAEKFFSAPVAQAEPPAEKPAPEKKPVATPAPVAKPVQKPAVPNPLDLLKGKSAAATPETPAATETPTESAEDDVDKGLQAPPDNAKSRAGWDELKKRASEFRTKATAAEQQLATLQKQLEEVKKTAPIDEATKARLSELEQQNKTMSERLRVLDVRSHPEFESKYSAPMNKAKAQIADLLKTEEIEGSVDELLSLKGKKFNEAASELLEKLTPLARLDFQAALGKYREAERGANEAVSQAEQFLKTAHQSGAARNRAVFDQVGSQFKGGFAEITLNENASEEEKAAAQEYNSGLAEIAKRAEQYGLGRIDEPTAASLAHKAAHYDFLVEKGIPRIGRIYEGMLAQANGKIAELEKQVSALSAAKPTLSGGSGAAPDDAPPAEEDHLSAARRYFKA